MKPIHVNSSRRALSLQPGRTAARRAAPLLGALALLLAGCGGIGDGNTLQSLKIQLSGDSRATSPFMLHQCLRDQLQVVGTFNDGRTADFSYRAQWSTSDPALVQVSNFDLPQVAVVNGAFSQLPGLFYPPGVIEPRAASGTVTITASFVGLRDSVQVTIDTAQFMIAPLAPGVDPQAQPPARSYLGPATTRRFAFMARESSGRILVASPLNLFGSLNPVLWSLVGGEFQARDSSDATDFDKFAVPTAAAPTAVVHVTQGVVTGRQAEMAAYEVQATTALCPTDPVFRPTAEVQVAAFDATTPLTLAYEAGFNGAGVPPNGEMFAGTGQALVVTANLDSDGDGAGDQTQDLTGQVDLALTHTTTCTQGDANCTCDTGGTNCTKRLVASLGLEVFTLVTTDGATADAVACFTDLDTLHTDDCDEDAAGEAVALKSNVLSLTSIPVDLTGTGATLSVVAPAPAPALSYPGPQFEAYGTFTALSGTPFAGGTSATGTQKLTRRVTWTTRAQGETTGFSDLGGVRNSGDGFYNPIGSFTYFQDVTADTVVDVSITPAAPLDKATAPAPVGFTICPSTGC
jgi:hypothetical protein